MVDVPRTTAEFLVTALPEVRTWPARPGASDLAALPGCPALYLLSDAHAAPVQLATTQSLKRVLVARLTDPLHRPRRADLTEVARGVRWRRLSTPFEGRWWYYRVARALYPQEYRRLISFGPAWFLHVDWDCPVPELRVTEQVWGPPGQFVGPWPTQRAARETLEGLWDLFDLCRYPEQVRKTPQGARCAYAEMGRCDAPCDGSVPLAAYVARCRAAWRFVTGGCGEWTDLATERMKRAAAVQKYELAAQLRQQIQLAEAWRVQWAPHVQPAERMHCLLAFPATRRRACKLFHFRRGDVREGPVLAARQVESGAVAWLRAQLAEPAPEPPSTVRMEQTWLLAHLLYGSERKSALLVPLSGSGMPPELEGLLIDWMARMGLQQHPAPPEGGQTPTPERAPAVPPADTQDQNSTR